MVYIAAYATVRAHSFSELLRLFVLQRHVRNCLRRSWRRGNVLVYVQMWQPIIIALSYIFKWTFAAPLTTAISSQNCCNAHETPCGKKLGTCSSCMSCQRPLLLPMITLAFRAVPQKRIHCGQLFKNSSWNHLRETHHQRHPFRNCTEKSDQSISERTHSNLTRL